MFAREPHHGLSVGYRARPAGSGEAASAPIYEPARVFSAVTAVYRGSVSWQSRSLVCAGCLALALAGTACSAPGGSAPGPVAGTGRPVMVVGSFNFPESILLAYLYADALAGRGYPARVLPGLGTRELVDPALMTGLVQLVPEYTGSALEFVSLGRVPATASVEATAGALATAVAGRGLITAWPAAAQDGNAIVVTGATAARYRLRTISDLAVVAPRLVFGGPPECPERAYCLAGLRRAYGLRFREFVPLDAGGPLTRQALAAGDIDVALLFTTDPAIKTRNLVVLADNRGLQPAESVVPLLRRDTAERYGAGLLAALDAVSARLTTAELAALDTDVELDNGDPRTVAERWLRVEGLAGTGRTAAAAP
jgi:osmoprotectant transport system substrate-binding protein